VGIAVFDIDGVVADVAHRLPYLERRPKDWDAFFAAAVDDPALPIGLALVEQYTDTHDIVWLTGRPERIRGITRGWLRDQGLPSERLHMRRDIDRRPAPHYKLASLRRLAAPPNGPGLRDADEPGRPDSTDSAIVAFVDDDDDVVRVARQAGFPAVYADWAPRAPSLRQAQHRLGRT
jgi:hypothetical protein